MMKRVPVLGRLWRVGDGTEFSLLSFYYMHCVNIYEQNCRCQYTVIAFGALSTISTRMYCQLKYCEWSVLMQSIHNYVLPSDSTVTGQSCQLCFLHSTDIRRRGAKLLNCYTASFLITVKMTDFYYCYYSFCLMHEFFS